MATNLLIYDDGRSVPDTSEYAIYYTVQDATVYRGYFSWSEYEWSEETKIDTSLKLKHYGDPTVSALRDDAVPNSMQPFGSVRRLLSAFFCNKTYPTTRPDRPTITYSTDDLGLTLSQQTKTIDGVDYLGWAISGYDPSPKFDTTGTWTWDDIVTVNFTRGAVNTPATNLLLYKTADNRLMANF